MNIYQRSRKILIFKIFLICIVSQCFSFKSMAQSFMGERLLFNKDWRFQKNDPADIVEKDSKGKVIKSQLDYSQTKEWYCSTGADLILPGDSVQATKRPAGNLGSNVSYAQASFNDQNWRQLNLPHDWGIEGAFSYDLPGNTGKLPWAGTGWYRKHFNVSDLDKKKQIFIDIDGAMAYPMVWLNGQFVGGWPYGYSSFRLDLTPYIKYGGDNVISIRLSNPENSSRWYPGSGIYRNVWLVKTNQVHIGHWGTFITTPQVSKASANVELKVMVDNQTKRNAEVTVNTKIFELKADGTKVTPEVAAFTVASGIVAPLANLPIVATATINNPKLWTIENPNRYVAVTTVSQVGGRVIDKYETPFGVRSIKFDANNGFLLNGKRVELYGVCNHHDLGALGTAFNVRAAERQLEILKEMGFNALRTSHNMPAPELLDLCDRMGILVMDESFDCWKKGKESNDYGMLFDDWHARDLRAEVHRDRNHPSVIQWSIGNEVRELNLPEGPAIAAHLTAIVNGEDPTRTSVVGSNSTVASSNGLQNAVGVYGINYHITTYGEFHTANSNRPVLGSETASCVSSRGEYVFPVTTNKLEGRGRFQVSSYDYYAPNWANAPDPQFKVMEENPFMAGEYVWTGMDYLGEPTPFNNDVTNLLNINDPTEKAKMAAELKELGKVNSPSRSSYFGIVDLAGFKKDRFYIYQAHWRPELPMAHILPHWNWAERVGQITPVHVYTSGDEAELYLNDVSLGRKKKEPFEYRIKWDSVVYAPGVLQVIAYKNGKKWAEETIKTTGAASKLSLQADRNVIKADGLDLSFITVTIADKDGLLVPRTNNLIKFEISGPGEIVGVDNGDATSFESFLAKEHKAFNGLALVIIRSKEGEAGTITLKATSDGLKESSMQINSEVIKEIKKK